jgi:hypothetical protein
LPGESLATKVVGGLRGGTVGFPTLFDGGERYVRRLQKIEETERTAHV